jgi:hypothetical protein
VFVIWPLSFVIAEGASSPKARHRRRRVIAPKARPGYFRGFALYSGGFTMRLSLLLSLVLVCPAFGELQWQNPEQNLKAKPGDKAAVVKFEFVNTGQAPVKILNVRTSCGCTTAALGKDEYAPGETGSIDARFEFGSHTGHQEKTIMVTTSDAPNHPTYLRLAVDIPQAVVLQPEFMLWKVGDPMDSKKFRVAIGDGFTAKLLGVESDNPAIQFVVNSVTPGKELEVTVTPNETNRPLSGTLLIKTDYPPENPQTYYEYVRVQ